MEKKTKIIFTLQSLLGGGAERVIVNIIRLLDKNRYDVTLLLCEKGGPYLELIPDHVKVLSLNVKRTRYSLIPLIIEIRRLKPDIIFSTTVRMNIFVLLASYFLPKSIRIFVREPNMPQVKLDNGAMSEKTVFLIRKLYKRAFRAVAQTNEMKDEMINVYGLNPDKIVTLINPVDSESMDAKLNGVESPYEAGYINFVYVGRIEYQKGYDIVINAMKKVKDNVRLYMIGEGSRMPDAKERIVDAGLSDKIKLMGFQNNPFVYIKYADALILPSRWEGLPNVVLEAVYMGTPVIMTKVNSFCEKLLSDKKIGKVVENEELSSTMMSFDMKHYEGFIATDASAIDRLFGS